jgi:hypothetical protein
MILPIQFGASGVVGEFQDNKDHTCVLGVGLAETKFNSVGQESAIVYEDIVVVQLFV